MASLLNLLPSAVLAQLETPRWIIFTVSLIGVLLAYVTDEGCSLLVDYNEAQEKPKYTSSSGGTPNSMSPKKAGYASSVRSPVKPTKPLKGGSCSLSLWRKYADAFQEGLLPLLFAVADSIFVVIRRLYAKASLYRVTLSLKRQARSKRHFFYLMEKKILGLPVHRNETEVDSYLDCKEHLGETWPFMWEVANVKDDKVACSGFDCVPMSSYSYLDFIRDGRVQEAAIDAARKWSSGNHGPRMLGGNMTILRDLEKVVAKFFGRDDSLLCATGYLACMSACAAISTESTVIFADARLHASLRAGLRIGDAKVIWFKHNDFEDCEKRIEKYRSKYADAWMIIESVYSMDGDICDLPAAHALCKTYDLKMMIDEAHGLGVVGKTGRGVEEHFGLQGCATLIVGTFSKSIASIGGYIAGSARFIKYLDFHALGNVFSAPLPAYSAGAALKSFELIDAMPEVVTKAQTNSKMLRRQLETGAGRWPEGYPEEKKYQLEGDVASTVIPVVFPDDIDRVMRIATQMKQKGFMCSAVAYPACPLRRPRFRITATSAYDADLIDRFVKAFVDTCVKEEPSNIKQELLS